MYVQPEKTERKKRARRTASDAEPVKDPERKRRRRKGKLARLPEMPIDVLFEVLSPGGAHVAQPFDFILSRFSHIYSRTISFDCLEARSRCAICS